MSVPADRWSVYVQPGTWRWVEVAPAIALRVGDQGHIREASPGRYLRVTATRWSWLWASFHTRPWCRMVRAALVEFSGEDRIALAEQQPMEPCA